MPSSSCKLISVPDDPRPAAPHQKDGLLFLGPAARESSRSGGRGGMNRGGPLRGAAAAGFVQDPPIYPSAPELFCGSQIQWNTDLLEASGLVNRRRCHGIINFLPTDTHDWDSTQVTPLIDGVFNGQPRKMPARANRGGWYFPLDRTNCNSPVVKPFLTNANACNGAGAQGLMVPDTDKESSLRGSLVSPSSDGASNYSAQSSSPDPGLLCDQHINHRWQSTDDTAILPAISCLMMLLWENCFDIFRSGSCKRILPNRFSWVGASAWSRPEEIRCMASFYRNQDRTSTNFGSPMRLLRSLLLLSLCSTAALAQLPEGPGKEVTVRICSQCHEIERAVALRQDRDGWQTTINKMSVLGMQAKAEEIRQAIDYLAKNYAGEGLPKVNVNTASPIDMESALSLTRTETAALVAYRTKHGKFKSLDDLKKIPGVSFAKFEANKDRLAY
jgi:competence ComEA-like helix-hairpin-helix protein